jgi:DNA primase
MKSFTLRYSHGRPQNIVPNNRKDRTMYNPSLDFKYLKAKVSIGQVLAAYGLGSKLRRQNQSLYGPCPLHGGDNPTAFHVHLNRGLWRCFTACGGGDVVDLICSIENCTEAHAAHILSRLIGYGNPSSLSLYSTSPASDRCIFSPFVYHIPLRPSVPFLQEVKKISVSTALCYEAGITNKSPFLRGTVAVRLHDLTGQPLGYCGRYLDPKAIIRWGKWRFPKNFPKKNVLYNAHRALCSIKQGIIVVECPWAVMRLAQAGVNNAVALLGTTISPPQLLWLSKAPKVLLLLDGDQPGRNAASHIANILQHKTTVFIHYLPDHMEPEDLSDNELTLIVNRYFNFS